MGQRPENRWFLGVEAASLHPGAHQKNLARLRGWTLSGDLKLVKGPSWGAAGPQTLRLILWSPPPSHSAGGLPPTPDPCFPSDPLPGVLPPPQTPRWRAAAPQTRFILGAPPLPDPPNKTPDDKHKRPYEVLDSRF